jgi:hypothetical protein
MKNILHTRCHINNNVYGMIINSVYCANFASTILVRKLNLNIIKHEKPYKIQ